MIKVSLQWIAEQLAGCLICHDGNETAAAGLSISNVTIDSRQVGPGDLFIAIKGPTFDGHDYAGQALEQGAAAVVVNRDMGLAGPQLLVENTRYALGQLAAAVKQTVAPTTIAITGSSGKTTVKEMLATILRLHLQGAGEVLATAGNFNNDIGVPLTLLRLTPEHKYAVLELGANHRGEIAYTTGLTKPDVALINNVAPAHVEGFGDICGVARAKMEIFRELDSTGVAITPAQSDFHALWVRELENKNHWVFATTTNDLPAQSNVKVWAEAVQIDNKGCAEFVLSTATEQSHIKLAVPGIHNVSNALAAASCCLAVGVPMATIASGLSSVNPVPGRMWVHETGTGVRVIDDTYNANVGSARAAIDVLRTLPGHCIFVLGDMGELGVDARAYHEEIGDYALQAEVNELFTVGVLSQSASDAFSGQQNGRHFDNKEALTAALLERVAAVPELTILVKGSRSAQMERIVDALLAHTEQQKQQRGEATC